MKVDGFLEGHADPAQEARELEEHGYSGLLCAEIANDPFFPLLLAAQKTQRIELMTSIAVAFARSPMILANIGNDLQTHSKGRFVLGLGSQIAPHIEKRFSMPWSHPAARMREFIEAMRAIWRSWYEGEKLDFRGDFYTHTLMTPMFTPTDNTYGPPKVLLAAVGPKMTEVAAEVADGILIHAFTTARYLREVTLPAIERGLAKSGKSRDAFEICYPGFVVTGRDERTMAKSRAATAKQIAFYGSTPAYRPVLAQHGWGELQTELNVLSKRGEWDEMGERIDDEILGEFAIVGEPDALASAIKSRYGGIVDRFSCSVSFESDAQRTAFMETLGG